MDDKHGIKQGKTDPQEHIDEASQTPSPAGARQLPNTSEINGIDHIPAGDSIAYAPSGGDPSVSLNESMSGSLNIRPSSEDSIIRRIRGFEEASELDLPMEQMHAHIQRGTDIGSILDKKYRIVHKIATGGMGTVFSAVHVKLGKQFAIKVISPGTLTNEEAHRRFVREAKASTLLSSPHTVRVFDYNITDWGEPYLVMEYISGRNLRQIIKKDGAMDPERAIHIVKQIAQSLMEAHDHGLVHRDLKPSNVMLMQVRGHTDFVKIFDFGVVKFMTSPDDLDLTRQGAMLGTPRYMAPEQINTPEDVSFGADIYSLGLLLYYILTGEKPYGELSSNVVVVTKLDKKGGLKLPKQLDIPRDLRTLFDKMTAFDHTQRPNTEDVYIKLADLETELKVGTYSGSSMFLLPSQKKSNRGFIALLIFLFALIGGLGWAFWPADENKKPNKRNPILARKGDKKAGLTTPPTRRPTLRGATPDAGSTAPDAAAPKRLVPRPISRPRRAVKVRLRPRPRPRKRNNARSWKQRIRVVTTPRGARIIIAGRMMGTTPMTITKPRHKSIRLTLKKDGHFSKTILIPKRARNTRYSIRLKEIRIEMP